MKIGRRDFLSNRIKSLVKEQGFLSCGISKAVFLEEEAPRLEYYLKQNLHGEMYYMENHFDKRLDPTLLVPGAKSVISLLYNYYPRKILELDGDFKIAKYAYGQDYHLILKEKLQYIVRILQEEIGEFEYRVFVDSAPVLERAWAKKSGLGWVGKNGNLLAKKSGSFFFLAEIICDLELEYDMPTTEHCGKCTKCIDACPTEAIISPQIIDSKKCISYLTIELKNEISTEFTNKMDNWIFGCDICQDVCPWNRFSIGNSESWLQPNDVLRNITKAEWQELSQETFSEVFRKSPIKRAKLSGLQKNINFIMNNIDNQ